MYQFYKLNTEPKIKLTGKRRLKNPIPNNVSQQIGNITCPQVTHLKEVLPKLVADL